MTLTEGFVKDEVFIDFGAEIMFGSDQCYIDYPCRFPTVEFQLMATNGLSQIADRIRKDMGFKPMHPMDEYTDDTCDTDGTCDTDDTCDADDTCDTDGTCDVSDKE